MITTLTALSTVAHTGGYWGGGFAWLFFLIPLFWIGVFVLLASIFGRRWRRNAWAHGSAGHYGHWSSASRSAEASLAERFAQGDIDEKEYRARLEVLRANNGPQQPPAA